MNKEQINLAKDFLMKLKSLISTGAFLNSGMSLELFAKNKELYKEHERVDENYRVSFSDIFILVSANLSTLIYGKEHSPWVGENINVQEISGAVNYIKLADLAEEFLVSI